MATNDPTAKNDFGATPADHDPRPRYILLGIDDSGCRHYYNTRTETIRVVDGRVQVARLDVAQRPVDDYVKFVRDQLDGREWADRRYRCADEAWTAVV